MSRLDPRAPLVVDTRDLSRRAGSQQQLRRTVPAPAELGVDLLRVPEGSDLDLDLRLEAVLEGVLVTGAASYDLEGECARCLEALGEGRTTHFQELFLYDQPPEDEDESPTVVDEYLDLEPVLRDVIVLELPLQPLCRLDCLGLCPDCGANLNDDPDHGHGEPVDPRLAGLADWQPTEGPA